MTTQDIIQYFKSIATTAAEELYIEHIFAQDALSLDDVAFLTRLQEKQTALLEKRDLEIDEAMNYLSFDEKDIIHTFEEEEESDGDLKAALFQEAFSLRNTEEESRDTDEAIKIKEMLLRKK